MTTKEFCVELVLAKYPNASPEFIQREVKEPLEENIEINEIIKYLGKKFIQSEHLEREARQIDFYSIHSKELFNE